MALFVLWQGSRHSNETVEFDGENLGEVREETKTHVTQTTIYRATDGRIVIHVVRSSNEGETARVWVFPSIDKARERFGWALEAAGIHPSRRANLRTFEGWDL
jgi:hypothetical protein